MGYTHYWRTKRDFTDKEWTAIESHARTLIAENPGILGGGYGVEEPAVDDQSIWFNGIGNLSHETFWLKKCRDGRSDWMSESDYDRDGEFNFCKTARKPYDAAVIRILAKAREIAPDAITLESDGGNEVFNGLILHMRAEVSHGI